jgi:hypothetical protein
LSLRVHKGQGAKRRAEMLTGADGRKSRLPPIRNIGPPIRSL